MKVQQQLKTLTALKAISDISMDEFYQCVMTLKKKDLEILKDVLVMLKENPNSGIESYIFEVIEYISITDFRKETGLKGKKLENEFRIHLLNIERKHMGMHSINFAYNKDNKYFK